MNIQFSGRVANYDKETSSKWDIYREYWDALMELECGDDSNG